MKKILAVVLGAITASSFADVTLYGRVAAAVENDTFPQSNITEPSVTSIQDYGSYFGIRGSDQVYGQTAAIWQIEQFLDISSGTNYQNTSGSNWVPANPNGGTPGAGVTTAGVNVLGTSDTYIGLQGGWGRIKIGNLSNTYRTNTGAVDIYNGNNANIMGTYDRFVRVLPETIRFDSPTWGNFGFNAYMSLNQDGNFNAGGINGNGVNGSGGLNGHNGQPIWGLGLSYNPGNFSATYNFQMAQNTGVYRCFGGDCNGLQPGSTTNNPLTVSQGINAWSSRIELGYNNVDSWFFGLGGQISQGYGYQSVAGNGNMNNLWINSSALGNINSQYINTPAPGATWASLNTAVLSTAEAGLSFGWHLNNWTPKIGYMYGSNVMVGGSPFDLIAGNNGLAGTGYQQLLAELDWNITPRTIAFVSWGQQWWGDTAQNMVKNETNPGSYATIQSLGGSMYNNNMTTAVGFSHTF